MCALTTEEKLTNYVMRFWNMLRLTFPHYVFTAFQLLTESKEELVRPAHALFSLQEFGIVRSSCSPQKLESRASEHI